MWSSAAEQVFLIDVRTLIRIGDIRGADFSVSSKNLKVGTVMKGHLRLCC